MRVSLAVLLLGLAFHGPALAQDLCSNIRLSVSEQIECRGRLTNALGDGDRTRIQQEFEDRIRRANDQLITPPVLRSQPPPVVSPLPNTAPPARPAAPVPPDAPALPGSTPNPAGVLTAPPGDVAPRAAPPSGATAIAPDLTAPDPAASPLPPISPLPPSPTGSPAVLK
ncbi:MAG: hypothetical protein AB7H70_10780 [Rhodospirillaceae bacterium]